MELALTIAERRCRRVAGPWVPLGADVRFKVTRPWPQLLAALLDDPLAPAVAVIEAEAGLGATTLLQRTADAVAAGGGASAYATAAELVRELAGPGVSLADAVARCRARRPAIGGAPSGDCWLALDDVDALDARDRPRLLQALAAPGDLRCVIAARPGTLRPRGATVWQLLPFDAAQRRQAIERRLGRADAAALRAHAIADPALDALLELPLFVAAACALVRAGRDPRALTRRDLYRACVDRPGLGHRSLDEYRTARALAPSIRPRDPDPLAAIRAVLEADAPALGLPWMVVAEGADPATVVAAIGRARARSANRRPPGSDRAGLALALEVWLEHPGPAAEDVGGLLEQVALCLERGQRRRRDGTWAELDDAPLAAAALAIADRAGLSEPAAEVAGALRVLRSAHRGHDPAFAPAIRDRARWSSVAGAVEAGLGDPCALVRWAALWAATATVARRGDPGFALADRVVALLGDRAAAVRSLAARALVAIGEPAAPRLLAIALAARDPDIRAGAAVGLGALGTADADAILVAAADALLAAPAVDAGDPTPAAIFGALESRADALARAGRAATPAAAALADRFARALERGLPRIAAIAASGLGKVGALAAAARLAPLLADRDDRVAASAGFALERLCDRFARAGAAELIPLLRQHLDARDPLDVRRSMAAALHHLALADALDDAATLDALAGHAGDDDERVAAACLGALAASRDGATRLAAAAAADPLIGARIALHARR